jgi:hypothetical protein
MSAIRAGLYGGPDHPASFAFSIRFFARCSIALIGSAPAAIFNTDLLVQRISTLCKASDA